MSEDLNDLLIEALLFLGEIRPRLATVYWLHEVERYTEADIAREFGTTERTVRRDLNGYTNARGAYIWGAKDWLEAILDLFLEARHCQAYLELNTVLAYTVRRNPWGEPFPVTFLDICWTAMDHGLLRKLLACFDQARRGELYDQLIAGLLACYDEGNLVLDKCFAGLCPVPSRQCVIKGS
jgi:hypothetical protein